MSDLTIVLLGFAWLAAALIAGRWLRANGWPHDANACRVCSQRDTAEYQQAVAESRQRHASRRPARDRTTDDTWGIDA